MLAKAFEIRDSRTFIPCIAICLSPANESEEYLAARVGFGITQEAQVGFVILLKMTGNMQTSDPNAWGCRTMTTAHKYIRDNFEKLESGAVIDVQFILGETKEPKESERITVS